MAEYIERGASYEDFEKCNSKNPKWTPSRVKTLIARQKAADVAQVRHGQWIEYTKVIIPEPYNKWEQAWKCSECGFDDGFVAYNYCPSCGAKMDGGNEDGKTDV